MCKIRCPLCRKRICDLIAIAEGRAVVRIRCPHCGRTVRLEWLVQTSLKMRYCLLDCASGQVTSCEGPE